MSRTRLTVLPLADRITRTVIVIGSTGVGKSTVVNMLCNQASDKDSCTKPAITGNTAAAITAETMQYVSLKAQSLFIDTIGFGDPKLSNKDIVKRTHEFVDKATNGINGIVVVVKIGRLSSTDRLHLEIFDRMFRSCWKEQSVLVLTHYNGDLDKNGEVNEALHGKALEDWQGNDENIRKFVKSFAKVIITDNNLGRNEAGSQNLRKACLKQLQSSIENWENPFGISSYTLYGLMTYIQMRFLELFGRVIGINQPATEPVFCTAGECTICCTIIEFSKIGATGCNHMFHSECIRKWLEGNQTCPLCRQPVFVLYTDE